MNIHPLGLRFFVGSIVAATALSFWYLKSVRGMVGLPSGRTEFGIILGILGTLAMLGAALYSWRRRSIARAMKPVETNAEQRKQVIARERAAMEQFQALQRQIMRNPNIDPKGVARDAKKIIKQNKVGRTIRARAEGGVGKATTLILERQEWGGRLQTWYYWHLSLGCLSLLLILFHSGFRFGSVIATLAFICLAGVVITGILGVYLYWTVPPQLTRIEERAERSPEELREEFSEVTRELEELATGKSEAFRKVYQHEIAIPGVSMKPTVGWLIARPVVQRDTARPDRLRLIVKEIPPSEQEDFRKVIRLIFRKEKIEVSLFPQLRYDYLMKIWLTAHIPLSAGMWAFSVIHIASVGYF